MTQFALVTFELNNFEEAARANWLIVLEVVFKSLPRHCGGILGRGGGLVVSMLAFYSNHLSSIPVEVYNFSVKMLLKRTKINKKRPELVEY